MGIISSIHWGEGLYGVEGGGLVADGEGHGCGLDLQDGGAGLKVDLVEIDVVEAGGGGEVEVVAQVAEVGE